MQAKIREKENQIDEVSKKIDAITKELQIKGQKPTGLSTSGNGKKAVRIQEPEISGGHSHLDVHIIDPVSDSGYTSTATTKTSHFTDEPFELESSFI